MDCPPRKCGRCREAAVSEGSTVIYISTFIRAFTCDPNGTWLAVDSLNTCVMASAGCPHVNSRGKSQITFSGANERLNLRSRLF